MPKRSRASAASGGSPAWYMDEEAWYAETLKHWQNSVSHESDDGVLGGWAEVDPLDVKGSIAFVGGLLRGGCAPIKAPLAGLRALDLGAGIGRVADGVLLKVAERVTLVEVSAALIGQARVRLAEHAARVEFVESSLRTFAPEPGSYDLVWAQWVLGHLTDTDVVGLLSRCRGALRPGGAIVVKDNNAPPSECDAVAGKYLLDDENAAVIRSHGHLQNLCRKAGLRVATVALVTDFPDDLFAVRMYWLTPK